MKKIGILGSGMVGKTLGDGFIKHGYQVMIGTRDRSKLEEWKTNAGDQASIGSFAETAAFGDIIILAVKGAVAKSALGQAGEGLVGKTILDATNPIDDSKPPVNGVLHFFSDLNRSLMEDLQEQHPQSNFVKCFSCVGAHLMVNPEIGGQKPTMFIAGNDESAKSETKQILDQFGWETADMGAAEAARAIEPLCMLWCIPGFKDNQWSHAFKLLK